MRATPDAWWHVMQFDIPCGYANSIACDWCVSCITLAWYAYGGKSPAAAAVAARPNGPSTIYCQSR